MIRPLAATALLLAAGCASRATLTETHGRSTRAAFARQVANPGATSQAPRGLDSQESAIVAESFREGLAPRGHTAKESPMLLVAPPQQQGVAGQRQQLAPSVPGSR